jgi:hypothetical protein
MEQFDLFGCKFHMALDESQPQQHCSFNGGEYHYASGTCGCALEEQQLGGSV